ncbi:hypothetical protein LEN26_000053 [Aphanomyces euteiches]|nr:hypothetical protein LEN26_000053 [Aphanomyces euteiches]
MVNSKFRKRWEICVVCVLVLFLIDVPLHIAFNSPKGWFVYSVRLVLDIFLVIDFLFRARYFAYVEMDTVITNSWFIWREYLRHGLVLDAISNIPFAMAADLLPSSTPQWLFLTLQACEWLRFLRMRSLFSTLSNVLKQYHVNNTTYIIVCIVLCVPFTCHIGGCVWYWISKITSSPSHNGHEGNHMTLKECLSWARDFDNCTWLDFDHAHFGHSSDYVRAFYWSVVSLVTVQFGSILPFTDAECVYMFLWLFLSSTANYGALGALANAVTRINWAISAKQLQVAVAHRFMLSERVSRTVRRDVNDYYKHHWTQSTEHQVMSVLKPLPDNLRQEIQTFLHEKSVKHVKIFMHVNADGLRFIYSVMKHQSYKRHEFLVRAGDACDTIYIITRGVVEALLSLDDFQVPVQLHYPGDCIGEAAFIQKRPHDLSFRVVGGSLDVSVLDRHEFMTGAMHFTHLGPEIDAIAAELFQSETKFVEQIERNLRRAHIYRTLNQSPTLYIEPKLDDYLIRPGSMYYRLWELLISAVVTYNLIQISFRIAMLLTPSHDLLLSIWIIDIICDIIFLVDMYIKYNHLIHMDKNGDEVVSVSLIRANYLQGAFKLEALSSLPLYYFGDFRIMTACRLPRLLRCYQLPSLLHTFHMFVQEQTSSAIISEGLEFLKLFIGLVLASHLAATGLYFISYQQYTSMHTSSSNDRGVGVWYKHDFVIEEDPHSLSMVYLRAFYWGLGVLSSFDYMDMEVAMVGETLWFCAVALSGVLFIGVVIGQVTTAIFNANKEIREVEMQVDNFAFYAKMKNLPPYLIRRATLFFQFQLDCNRGMDAHVIFEDLPQSLRLELFHDLYSSMLAKIPIFSSFTKGQLNTIAEKLHTRLYLPGDNIVVEGDMGSSLYFLKQGLGEKYLRSCHLIIAPCYKGAVFGEAGFFLSMRYVYCVRAVKCCEILCLSKADWSEAWSADVRAKLEAKVMRDIQHELSILRRNIHAIKQNFGITRPIPLKLTMMLESSSSAGIPQTTADVSGRNFFEYLKHTAPSKAKVNPLATAPLREFTIWSLGPPPAAVWKPDSLFRQTWDIMMLGVVIYYAFLIPFRASFIFVPTMPPLWLIIWLIWDYFLDILCIVDTILRWQVFYVFVEGEVQTNRAILRRHYQTHGHFYADLLSLLPIEVFVLAFPHRNGWEMISLWRLNRMIRLSHFSHLLSTFQHILNRHHWFHDYKMIFQYIVAYVGPFFLVCHWVGCMWFHVSYTYRHMDSPSWLVTAGYINANETINDGIPIEFSETTQLTSLNLYLASLYYAVSSLTSQSLGDVFSRNPLETWLTIGIMIFSIAFYGLLVGILSEMVEDRLNPRATFEQRMVDISTFFNYRMLPFQFFIQTSRFFRTQWQEQLARTEDEFLGILSTTIREDIAMFVKQNFVKNLSFINHVEEVFVRALVTKLHTEDYIMSDVIFQLGDVGRVLYFINVGHITLVTSKNASKTCNVWDFFGGTSLFTDTGRQATAIANVNCTMFLLYFEDFDRVIQRFPEYYEPCRNEWNVSDAVELDNANRITQVPN